MWTYFQAHESDIWHWTWSTVWLAGLPLVIGLAVALPLGWLAHRYRVAYLPAVTVGGLIYTIPSLVLLIVLPGLLGTQILDPLNVAIALSLYSTALLIRVVADGLGAVSSETLDAAAAMGYTTRQRLLRVQLPIAVPVIGAGVRVAAVSNVSLVSVASLIGIPQLGSLFTAGSETDSLTPIGVGLVMIIALGLVFDGVVLIAVRLMTPWARTGR